MTCGVYAILCLPNNKFYIGSSSDIETRLDQHFWSLGEGKHYAPMQNAFAKYGEDSFAVVILQECLESSLLDVEQKWIDSFEWCRLFNIARKADRPPGGGNTKQAKNGWETRRKRYGPSGGNDKLACTPETAQKIIETRRRNGTLSGLKTGTKAWETRRRRYGPTGRKDKSNAKTASQTD